MAAFLSKGNSFLGPSDYSDLRSSRKWDQAFLYFMFPTLVGDDDSALVRRKPYNNVKRLSYSDSKVGSIKTKANPALFDFLLNKISEDSVNNYGLPAYNIAFFANYENATGDIISVQLPAAAYATNYKSVTGQLLRTNISSISLKNTAKNSGEVITNVQAKLSFKFAFLSDLSQEFFAKKFVNSTLQAETQKASFMDFLFQPSMADAKFKNISMIFDWTDEKILKNDFKAGTLEHVYTNELRKTLQGLKIKYVLQYVKHDLSYDPIETSKSIENFSDLKNKVDITYQVSSMNTELDIVKYPNARLSTVLNSRGGEKPETIKNLEKARKEYEDKLTDYKKVCKDNTAPETEKTTRKEAFEKAKKDLDELKSINLDYFLEYFLSVPIYGYVVREKGQTADTDFAWYKGAVIADTSLQDEQGNPITTKFKPVVLTAANINVTDFSQTPNPLATGTKLMTQTFAWTSPSTWFTTNFTKDGNEIKNEFIILGDVIDKIFEGMDENTKILFKDFKLKPRKNSRAEYTVNLLDYPISLVTWRKILDETLNADNLNTMTKGEFFVKILNNKIISNCLDIGNLIVTSDLAKYSIDTNSDNSKLDLIQTGIHAKVDSDLFNASIVDYTALKLAVDSNDGANDIQMNFVQMINIREVQQKFEWSQKFDSPLIFGDYTHEKYKFFDNILRRHILTGQPTFAIAVAQENVNGTLIHTPIMKFDFTVIENSLLQTSAFNAATRARDEETRRGLYILPHTVTIKTPSEFALFLNPGDKIYLYDHLNHQEPKSKYDFGYEGIYTITETNLDIDNMLVNLNQNGLIKRVGLIKAAQESFLDDAVDKPSAPPSDGGGLATGACDDIASFDPSAAVTP
jgi:hypothetical protein